MENDPKIWRPNAGPQRAFLSCGAWEVLYGGRAGGGKSIGLALDALRRVTMPHYAALLLRRTVPELKKSKGLLEIAWEIFPSVGGNPREGGMSWFWDGGGRIDLASMEHEQDRYNYSGSEYHWIGFDEATTFTGRQYLFMTSRMRPTHGIPTRLRAATNPGGEGHDFFLQRFSPWVLFDDPDYDGPRARPGERLSYRLDDDLDQQVICDPSLPDARSRTYFPASYKDTPQLGPEYVANLKQLDPLTRLQLMSGDWRARPAAGLMFKREWFSRARGTRVARAPHPSHFRQIVRAWDFAGTQKKEGAEGAESKQAASAGVLFGLGVDDRIYVMNSKRLWETPGGVRAAVKECGQKDDERFGRQVFISIPQDPGQAGVDQRESYARVLRGRWWHSTPERGDKVERAKPFSSACENGEVVLVDGDWTEAYLKELVDFPFGLKDQVDASSRGYHECLYGPALVTSRDRTKQPTRETARSPGDY